ncbi:MAG TPA: potassium channel protein [Actinobacteria bacterium]|nr:potassium channel protein [Actinomycetota bacterium]
MKPLGEVTVLEALGFKSPKNLNILSRLRLALTVFLIMLVSGTTGYVLIEKFTLLDAFYMTMITISTVGFREVNTLSPTGKIFTIFLIIGGVGTGIYALSVAVEFFIEGHLMGMVGERRMEKKINELRNHYIICGFGRVGRQIAAEFKKAGVPFVIIENKPEVAFKFQEESFMFIEGDATNDKILEMAGTLKAKGLIAAIDTDADNVFVVLSAKSLNPEIFIVARADLEESEGKLKKAGADRVISPTVIGGRRMASLILKPNACDYLDIVTHGEDLEFQLEEIRVGKNSILVNKTLGEVDIKSKTGTLVLAIRKDDKYNTNPSSSTMISEGDILIIIGTRGQMDALQMLVS